MGERTFGEQMNAPFNLDRMIRQDESRPGEIVSDPGPKALTAEDVLFKEVNMESITGPVEVIEETAILQGIPLGITIPYRAPAKKNEGSLAASLSQNESVHLRSRWNEIQGMFVDEPHTAVQQADELVSDVIEMVTRMLSNELINLKVEWKQGNDVSTEDLRQVMQHYRTFFNLLVV